MQYYNTVNKCVYKNKSNVESVNSICCHSQLCQKKLCQKNKKFVYIFYYMLAVVLFEVGNCTYTMTVVIFSTSIVQTEHMVYQRI